MGSDHIWKLDMFLSLFKIAHLSFSSFSLDSVFALHVHINFELKLKPLLDKQDVI